MALVFFLIVLIIIGSRFERLINKWLRVHRKNISDTPGKRINRWGRLIFGVIYVCSMPFIVTANVHIVIWFLVLFLVTLFSFQAFLEWKYLKNNKQYISTIILLIILAGIMYGVGILSI